MKLIITGLSLQLPQHRKPCRPTDQEWSDCYSSHTQVKTVNEPERTQILSFATGNTCPMVKSSFSNKIDLKEHYNIRDHVIQTCDEAGWYAIAAGLEALKDSNLSVYSDTGTLTGLHPTLQNTGVISIGMFPSLLSTVEGLCLKDKVEKTFLHRMIVRPNSHFSQLVKAKGPSVYIDTACSSTLSAIHLAEDWLRLMRCDRVIIIGADIPSDERLFPFIGAGFHRLGVLTTKPSVRDACRPFDRDRSGFILGSSAIGIVIERQEQESFDGQVELINSVIGNSAFLTLSLDEEYMSDMLQSFMTRVCNSHELKLENIAKDMIYVAHETSTPRCAVSELYALRNVFQDSFSSIIICGLKGLCGHSLSTSYEEVILIDMLRRKKLPPIIHLEHIDPKLGTDICLSDGGTHFRQYGLHFSAGFGSSVGYSFYRYHS